MSKAITEKKPEGAPPPDPFQPPRETAPSVMAPDEPRVARWVGTVGLTLVALGVISLYMQLVLHKATLINPVIAYFCVAAGLGCLLFHAISDNDLQVRRTYGMVGYFLLAAALLISVLPIRGPAGALFLPWGLLGLALGLLFVLAFVRNEDDVKWHDITVWILGGGGAVLAVVGLLGGSISTEFLLQAGLWLALLGLVYLAFFIGFTGTGTDLGYYSGLLVGLVGAVCFAVALGRSILPPLFFKWGWISPPTPYFIPGGLVLMLAGTLYVGLAVGLCSDNRVVAMTRRELAAYFYSPVAYIVLFGFTVIAFLSYWSFLSNLLPREAGMPWPSMPEPIILYYFFGIFPVIAVSVIVPLLTMRLLSEEKRTGTMEVLLTAPLEEASVVLSKFIAVFLFFLFLWLPWGLFLLALRLEGGQPFDYRPLLSFGVALACTGAGFLSMGLFFSSLTRNQIASGVLTFAGMLLLILPWFLSRWLTAPVLEGETNWPALLQHVSYLDLWITTLQGKLPPLDLLIQASAAVFWLFVTIKVVEARRWS
jgi:ABC-type transport system involved in multi-copper enzyme maturation permease subunit